MADKMADAADPNIRALLPEAIQWRDHLAGLKDDDAIRSVQKPLTMEYYVANGKKLVRFSPTTFIGKVFALASIFSQTSGEGAVAVAGASDVMEAYGFNPKNVSIERKLQERLLTILRGPDEDANTDLFKFALLTHQSRRDATRTSSTWPRRPRTWSARRRRRSSG